jgi:hypothetical protein
MQSAVFTGVLRWFAFHFRKGNLVTFSPLRQRGFVILRQSLPRLVFDAALQVAGNFRWFLLYFVFIGKRARYKDNADDNIVCAALQAAR